MIEGIKRGFFDNYNQRNWEALKEIYTVDAVIHTPVGDLKGGQAVVDIAKRKLKAMPDMQFTPLFGSYDDNIVVLQWCAKGTAVGSEKEETVFCGSYKFRMSGKMVAEQWEKRY